MFPFSEDMLVNIHEIFRSPVIQYHAFKPQNHLDLDMASFELEDGRCFLASDGLLGYRAWQTNTFVREKDLLIEPTKKGDYLLLWKSTGNPIERLEMWGLE